MQIEILKGLSNVYLIKCGNSGILVDAAVSEGVLKPCIKGITIKGILLTHGHYDHMYKLEEILNFIKQNNNKDCKCYMHKNAKTKLHDPFSNCSVFFGEQFISGVQEEDLTEIKDGDILGLFEEEGEKVPSGSSRAADSICPSVKVIETFGHTNCSLTFEIGGVLFTGDTIFNGAVGRTDCDTGNYDALIKSIKNLYERFEGFTFYAGHGSKGTL